jgi:hypothetical protein
MQGYGDPPQTGAVSRASLDNSSRSRSRSALAAAKGLSLNNRIGWWRGDPFTPSCRRRACPKRRLGSASASVLAAINKTWMAGLRPP